MVNILIIHKSKHIVQVRMGSRGYLRYHLPQPTLIMPGIANHKRPLG